MHRERQYIERLRDAPIPPASHDFAARIIARTQELAAEAYPETAHPESRYRGTMHPATAVPRGRPLTGAQVAVRALAVTAGGTAAAAGVLAAGAFALAGEPVPDAASSSLGSFSQVSAQTAADGRQLSEAQLASLRTEGWVCPELESLGFHLESAKATIVAGRPAVDLRLSDGTHYATLLEQHDLPEQRGAGSGPDTPALVVRSSSPWSATYRTVAGTFTYQSDLPPGLADDALPVLQRLSDLAAEGVEADAPPAPPSTAPESLDGRLQRGFNRIVGLFAP